MNLFSLTQFTKMSAFYLWQKQTDFFFLLDGVYVFSHTTPTIEKNSISPVFTQMSKFNLFSVHHQSKRLLAHFQNCLAKTCSVNFKYYFIKQLYYFPMCKYKSQWDCILKHGKMSSETLEHVSQRNCGCPILESIHNQAGWDFE